MKTRPLLGAGGGWRGRQDLTLARGPSDTSGSSAGAERFTLRVQHLDGLKHVVPEDAAVESVEAPESQGLLQVGGQVNVAAL
mgnify:CR=1 FL=1